MAFERPELGEWCEITAEAYKKKAPWSRGVRKVEWMPKKLAQPLRGMYIGWRTVFDGEAEYIGEEEGAVFKQGESREVWLFVTSPRKNPIRTFPNGVKREVKS